MTDEHYMSNRPIDIAHIDNAAEIGAMKELGAKKY